ncbi:MAG: SHOCT domain-containing protein [Polaromonas sp.]
MQQLSQSGQQVIDDIAQRHGFSTPAVLSMLESVINGNGSMAQFNHPEFAGSGQWMNGGMTMVSDMFNNYLKNRVNGLCSELARLLVNQPDLLRSGSFQSQNQGSQQQNNYSNSQGQNGGGAMNPTASLFIPPAPGTSSDWWGPTLRWPNSTGAQNGVRYAYFAQAHRLAIELNGKVTIYDTLDHQIGGFSQQQSYGGSISFNSQYGLIDVTSLPIVSVDGVAQTANTAHNGFGNVQQPVASEVAPAHAPVSSPSAAPPFPATPPSGKAFAKETDVFLMIEKLADLQSRGLISEEEFVAKKTELLARL